MKNKSYTKTEIIDLIRKMKHSSDFHSHRECWACLDFVCYYLERMDLDNKEEDNNKEEEEVIKSQ